MSDIVLAIGTSHSPLLNSPAEDYPKHAEIDASGGKLLDRQGRPCTYGELLEKADPTLKDQIRPEFLRQSCAHDACTQPGLVSVSEADASRQSSGMNFPSLT